MPYQVLYISSRVRRKMHKRLWMILMTRLDTVKPFLSSHSKRTPTIGFQDQLSLNAGQKYCRMLQGEHSAILSTFIKLLFVMKTFGWSILNGRIKQVLLYFKTQGTEVTKLFSWSIQLSMKFQLID